MLSFFTLPAAFALTATAVKWQSVSDYSPHSADSFSTIAPAVFDGAPGDMGTGFTDTSGMGGSAYSYQVSAVNVGRESSKSAKAFADPSGVPYVFNQNDWVVTDGLGRVPLNSTTGDGFVLAGPLVGTATQTYPAGMPAWPGGMAPFYQPQQLPDHNTASAPTWDFSLPYLSASALAGNEAPAGWGASDNRFYIFDYNYVLFGSAGQLKDTLGSVTNVLNGQVSTTWTWVGSGVPPRYLDLLMTTRLSASASLSALGTSGMASASDALGEAIAADAGTPNPAGQVGHHLMRVPVVNGVAVYALGGSASASAGVSLPVGQIQTGGTGYNSYTTTNGGLMAQTFAGLDATVQHDTRAVTISSSLDPTYYKDPTTGLPAQNIIVASGFMVADTVAPETATSSLINYYPNYVRSNWGTGSQYTWKFADNPRLSSGNLSGTFNLYSLGLAPG